MNSTNTNTKSDRTKTVFKVKDSWWIVITIPLIMVAICLIFTYETSRSPFDFVRELPVVLFILLLPGVLVAAALAAFLIQGRKLHLEPDRLEFSSRGLEFWTTWDNILEIGPHPDPEQQPALSGPILPEEWQEGYGLVLRNPGEVTYRGVFAGSASTSISFIPLEVFDTQWRTSELGLAIKTQAPHLLALPAAPLMPHSGIPFVGQFTAMDLRQAFALDQPPLQLLKSILRDALPWVVLSFCGFYINHCRERAFLGEIWSHIPFILIFWCSFVALISLVSRVWSRRRTIRDALKTQSTVSGAAGEEEIVLSTPGSIHRFKWETLHHLKQGKDLVLLYETEEGYHVFPRHFFKQEKDWQSFCDLAGRKTGKSQEERRKS